MATLALRNLRKEYGKLVALDGLDLHVGDGEFFVLLGPSGAGKTTTLKCVAGLESPTAGRVELFSGLAHFTADETGLTARVEAADVRGLLEVRYVVDRHLAIFAFREKFTGFAWSDPYA